MGKWLKRFKNSPETPLQRTNNTDTAILDCDAASAAAELARLNEDAAALGAEAEAYLNKELPKLAAEAEDYLNRELPAMAAEAEEYFKRELTKEAEKLNDRLEQDGIAKIRSGTLDEDVFFAVDDQAASKAPTGATVYTLKELQELVQTGTTEEELKSIHQAKKLFRGNIVAPKGEEIQ